jgi:hypothetical protein
MYKLMQKTYRELIYCTIILQWLLKEVARAVLLPATACGTNTVSHTGIDRIFLVYSCYRRYAVARLKHYATS